MYHTCGRMGAVSSGHGWARFGASRDEVRGPMTYLVVVLCGRRLQELHRLALEEDLFERVSMADGRMRRVVDGVLGAYHGGWG